MKILRLASTLVLALPLVACTNSFRARSPEAKALRKPIVTVSMNNADTLPVCEASTEGLSAFLAKAGTMFKCSHGDWIAQTPGRSTWGYSSRATVRYNQWEDLSTRKRWAIVPEGSNLKSSCDKGWRLPARDELLKASANGLFAGIKANGGTAYPRAWTHDIVNGKEERVAIGISPGEGDNPSATTGVYCVLDT